MKLLMEAFMNAAEVLDSAIVALVDTPINDDSSLFDRSLLGKHPIEYDVVRRSLVGFTDGNPSIVVAVVVGCHSKNRLIR